MEMKDDLNSFMKKGLFWHTLPDGHNFKIFVAKALKQVLILLPSATQWYSSLCLAEMPAIFPAYADFDTVKLLQDIGHFHITQTWKIFLTAEQIHTEICTKPYIVFCFLQFHITFYILHSALLFTVYRQQFFYLSFSKKHLCFHIGYNIQYIIIINNWKDYVNQNTL